MSTQCAADGPVRRRRSPGVVRRAPDPGPELCLALGVTGRLDLLNVLQSQLELFLWQGISPPPMSLQLLDDLVQPLAFRPLSQQHRLEQVRIVRQGFGGARPIQSITPPIDRLWFLRATRSAAARRGGHCRPPRLMHPPPIQPFERRLELGRAEPHDATVDRWPAELSVFQSLSHAGAVPEDQFHPVGESRDIVHPSFRGWGARGSYPLGSACRTWAGGRRFRVRLS
jgi:hypothetical protein